MKFQVFNKSKNEHQNSDNYFLSAKGELFEECKMDGILLHVDKSDKIVQFCVGIIGESGEEIYEGDWISADYNNSTYEGEVVYSPAKMAFVMDVSGRHLIDKKYGDFLYMHDEIKYKIIKK